MLRLLTEEGGKSPRLILNEGSTCHAGAAEQKGQEMGYVFGAYLADEVLEMATGKKVV